MVRKTAENPSAGIPDSHLAVLVMLAVARFTVGAGD
jgi:hypothetical protein